MERKQTIRERINQNVTTELTHQHLLFLQMLMEVLGHIRAVEWCSIDLGCIRPKVEIFNFRSFLYKKLTPTTLKKYTYCIFGKG